MKTQLSLSLLFTICFFIGHKVRHSSLQEEKSNAFEMVPFLETIVPLLLYWG